MHAATRSGSGSGQRRVARHRRALFVDAHRRPTTVSSPSVSSSSATASGRTGIGRPRSSTEAVPSSSSSLAVVVDAIEIDGLELVPVVHAVAADP